MQNHLCIEGGLATSVQTNKTLFETFRMKACGFLHVSVIRQTVKTNISEAIELTRAEGEGVNWVGKWLLGRSLTTERK